MSTIIIISFYLVPFKLLTKVSRFLDLCIQVTVLPPPPRGWDKCDEWTPGARSHLYWTLKTNFFSTRCREMLAVEDRPVTIRVKALNKKPMSPNTLRRLHIKKQREQNGWVFPGPFEPDMKDPLRETLPL